MPGLLTSEIITMYIICALFYIVLMLTLIAYYKNKSFYDLNEDVKYKFIAGFLIFTLIILISIAGPSIISNISTRSTNGSNNIGYQDPGQFDSSAGQFDQQFY